MNPVATQVQEAIKRFDEVDQAFADCVFATVDDPDKAQEALNKMKIHHESTVSALQAAITASRYNLTTPILHRLKQGVI